LAFKTYSKTINLIWLSLIISLQRAIEYIRVIASYYTRSYPFLKCDLTLLLLYFFKSPYQISKLFLESRNNADIHVYGETPLTTLELITTEAKILPHDTVYDLGCGTGRTTFWLTYFTNCKAVGIEQIPFFVSRAKAISTKYDIHSVKFIEENILEANYELATVVYFYGTSFEDDFIVAWIEKLSKLPKGSKVITVSYPLFHYTSATRFPLIKEFTARFTWGQAQVFIQYKA
jgi:SAM-dependent methyltransferase